jgi:hypothetical protein
VTEIDDLLSRIPTDQIAARLGVDAATADAAVRAALPALVGGMSANAQHPDGAASLAGALGQHDPGLVDGGVDVGQVDTADGQRIVGHVFGANVEPVAERVGGSAGVSRELIAKLLPLLAPIVMSYLAKRLGQSSGGPGGSGGAGGSGGSEQGGGLADILGSILGGTAGGKGGAGGIDLGSVLGGLGGLLGGGRR